jgi:aromatic ring hydroxylase
MVKKPFRNANSVLDQLLVIELKGTGGVGYLVESLHGTGSPMAQRIVLSRLADLGKKEKLALNISRLFYRPPMY